MNTETILTVWMDERVSMGSIARLFETDLVSVEDGIRAELRRLRSEAMKARPIDTEEIKRGPKRDNPTRRALRGDSSLPGPSGYPEALRDPRSTTLRAVWDALGIEPSGVSGIERTTGLGNKQVSMALMGLRDKCLVHKRDSDGAWERTVRE